MTIGEVFVLLFLEEYKKLIAANLLSEIKNWTSAYVDDFELANRMHSIGLYSSDPQGEAR